MKQPKVVHGDGDWKQQKKWVRFRPICYIPPPMGQTLAILIVTQMLYTAGDFMGRYYMRQGFQWSHFLSWWFLGYMVIRQIATFLQLYIFAQIPLGKTMALFGATSIIMSNALGFLFLKEMLSPAAYIGVGLSVVAIMVLAFSR